jgi:triacylglycerol lipase
MGRPAWERTIGGVLSSMPPARRRTVLLAAALLAAVVLVVAAKVAAGLRGTEVRPVDQSRPGPILIVPGYGGSTGSLSSLVRRLSRLDRPVQVVPLPEGGLGDLAGQARALGDAARSAMAKESAASVDVVGYSAGGVVARLWVREEGGGSIARRVVSLGSPQHGTELAGLGQLLQGRCPQACQQLSPTSPVLAALNIGDETPPGPRFVSIWTTRDDVVLPAESARLDGALNLTVQGVCAGTTVRHSDLPADPVVGAMVAEELGAGPLKALTTKDCARLGP